MEHLAQRLVPWFFAALMGLFCGYEVSESRSGGEQLRAEVARLRSELAKVKRSGSSRQAPAPVSGRRPVGQTSATLRSNAVSPPSGPKPVTEEDLMVARSLQERAARGEYVALFDSPISRKNNEAIGKSLASQIASNNAADLERLFTGFGLQPELREQLRRHLLRIDEAVGEAGMAVVQLQTARYDYDKKVRSLLSESDYAAYRAYEAAKPAQEQYGSIEEYARRQGVPLDPQYRQAMIDAIQRSKAYAGMSFYGPYNSVPPAIVGAEAALAHVEQRVQDLSDYAQQTRQEALHAGVPEVLANVLRGYYTDRMQATMQDVEFWRHRPDPTVLQKEMELLSTQRRSPP